MRKRFFCIVGSLAVVLLITVFVLMYVNHFDKSDKKATFIANRWQSVGANWNGSKLIKSERSSLLQISYSSPIIKNGLISQSINDWDYGEEWHKHSNDTVSVIRDSIENITKNLDSVTERNVIYFKSGKKEIEATIGDLIVLNTKDNNFDIPYDYETIVDNNNKYKMRIMVAIEEGMQKIEYICITEDDSKLMSTVDVSVKTKK